MLVMSSSLCGGCCCLPSSTRNKNKGGLGRSGKEAEEEGRGHVFCCWSGCGRHTAAGAKMCPCVCVSVYCRVGFG